jgi:hypothetical protein
MKRREFISLIIGATAWPLGARAQQPAMPVIGFLSPVPAAEAIPHLIAAFRQGLAEAGFQQGENLAIEYRFTNFKPELMQQAASDVVRRKVNVIYAHTPEGGAAARNATTSIPIVGGDLESDPIAMGYVKSLARPGGNFTGIFLDLPELSAKQVGLLKEIIPRLSRIAIFGIPGLNEAQFPAAKTAVQALRVESEIIEVQSPDDLEGALAAATTKHAEEADRTRVGDDPIVAFKNRSRIVANCFVQLHRSGEAVSLPAQASAVRVVAKRRSPQPRVIGSVGQSRVRNDEQGLAQIEPRLRVKCERTQVGRRLDQANL